MLAQELNGQGLSDIERGDYASAAKAFRSALDVDIFYAPAHSNLGLCLLRQGQAYEAAWEFQYAARVAATQCRTA